MRVVLALILFSQSALAELPIRIFASSSLQRPLNTVISDYQKKMGEKVIVNYGAAGSLRVQILLGQPFDLFLSTDWEDILKLSDLLSTQDKGRWLQDSLSLVQSKSAGKIASLKDLLSHSGAFAIAATSAPLGRYSEKALKHLNLWDKVSLKARPATANQLALLLQKEQIEYALLYTSQAPQFGLKIVETLLPPLAEPIELSYGLEKQRAALPFLTFLKAHADAFKKWGWREIAAP